MNTIPQLFNPEEPRRPRRPKLSVGDVVKLYIEANASLYADRSQRERERVLKIFSGRFGARPIADCIPADLEDWINATPAWASNWTRKRVIATVERCFNWAEKGGRIRRNPFKGVSCRTGDPGRDLTDAEFQTLLRKSYAPFRRILVFLRQTGARPGELRQAEWAQLNLERRSIVQAKHKTRHTQRTPRPRVIRLSSCAIKLLAWIKRNQTNSPTNIFLNEDSKPWTRRALCQHMERVRERAGLPADVKLYGCRHKFGTDALLNEVDVATLAELLGHTNIRTTMHYVHLANKSDHLIAALEKAVKRREP